MSHSQVSAVSFNGIELMPRGGRREGAGRPKGIPNPHGGRKPLLPGQRRKSTTLSLSAQSIAKLDAIAKRKGVSRSEAINRILKNL